MEHMIFKPYVVKRLNNLLSKKKKRGRFRLNCNHPQLGKGWEESTLFSN